MEYTMIIPAESEKHLAAFDNLVNIFGLRPTFTSTKDAFIYSFTFPSVELQEKFKIAVSNSLPNLYPDTGA